MGRIVKADWRRRRREKRSRRAVMRDAGVFVVGFTLTVFGGLAFASGLRPLEWLDDQRTQPLVGSIEVVDGDTIRAGGERIRLANIDTPEMPPRSRCADEAILAERAKANLEAMVASGREFEFVPDLQRERDVYGRLLGRVLIDGQDVGRAQFDAGLAQRWMGRHAEWC